MKEWKTLLLLRIYLYHTYNNKQKSLWSVRIQDVIELYPTEKFDVVSINNVLVYIDNDDEYFKTLKNLHRIIKPGGTIITDANFLEEYSQVGNKNEFITLGTGIFQKCKKNCDV